MRTNRPWRYCDGQSARASRVPRLETVRRLTRGTDRYAASDHYVMRSL